jgi:hypothetical protein
MNYTLIVFVGSIEYKRLTLRASKAAGTALLNAAPHALKAIRTKITELTDTYSWTHVELSVDGDSCVILARG